MLYILYCTLVLVAWKSPTAFSTPVTYDQRQTGDMNVQVHLKDVQVVALVNADFLEDYSDYDYSYDYSDFTIKPMVKPTTSSSESSTTTVKPWNTWPTNPPKSTTAKPLLPLDPEETGSNSVHPETTTVSISQEANNSSDPQANSTITNLNLQEHNDEDVKLRIKKIGEDAQSEDKSELEINHKGSKRACPTGYALNKKGRCIRASQLRRRVSLIPWTLELASKMSKKGRFPVRKDLPIRVYKSDPRE